MKKIKDHFSGQAQLYAQFRPRYPDALYEYIFSLVPQQEVAWDCGTGNGQVASRLAEKFTQVYATDISEQQMAHAIRQDGIRYVVARAEKTNFADNTFDLVTVGQALHWFDFYAFYEEVKRTCKDHAILAVWGYKLLEVSSKIDPVIRDFYTNITGPYWDEERKHIDDAYQSIPFPFEEIKAPDFTIAVEWRLAEMEGYFNTWSSVQKYIRQNGTNPVPVLMAKIKSVVHSDDLLAVKFPVFMRVGRVRK